MNLQLYAGVTLRGIQWVDSTVAVVISSDPHLLSQLESNVPPARGNIASVPQVHLAAEIKHQGLETHAEAQFMSSTVPLGYSTKEAKAEEKLGPRWSPAGRWWG